LRPSILVSGASGIIGYGILRSLRQSQATDGFRLIGTTIHDESVASAFCDVLEKAPRTDAPGYFDWLAEIIERHRTALVIPSIEVDVSAWSVRCREIEATGAIPMLNNPELIRLCADKWLFYDRLREADSPYAIATALTFDEGEHTFPLLLKPRCGSASRGIAIVENRASLEARLAEIGSELMIQPLVGCADEEYTTSAFFDHNGGLCAHMSLKRKLSKEGFTQTAETVEIPGIQEALEELAGIFQPVGPTNFQFRTEAGRLKLLEINPRISSATSIRAAFGYNESAMCVDYFLRGRMPVQPVLKTGRAVRYTEDQIFYDRPDF
jgi:carbamoyl-phosphate synthase large subunit